MDGLKTKEDRRFQTFWVIFFILISVIAIIPVLRVISISFSGRDAINKGQVFIFPIGFNVDAYAKALKSGTFVSSFGYSIILMAVVTAVDMIMTILLESGYARRIVIIISTAVTTAIRIMEYPKELTNVPLFNAFA